MGQISGLDIIRHRHGIWDSHGLLVQQSVTFGGCLQQHQNNQEHPQHGTQAPPQGGPDRGRAGREAPNHGDRPPKKTLSPGEVRQVALEGAVYLAAATIARMASRASSNARVGSAALKSKPTTTARSFCRPTSPAGPASNSLRHRDSITFSKVG